LCQLYFDAWAAHISVFPKKGRNPSEPVAYDYGDRRAVSMFNNKLSSIPNQNYRVDSHPSIDQLNDMIEKARGMSGIRHNYLWEIPKDFKKYTLSLHCKEKSYEETDIEWWLHEENLVGSKMLWFHKTKDIAVIYPHLLASIGQRHPLDEETEEQKQAKERDKPTSLGARLKRSTNSAELMSAPEVEPQEVTYAQEAGQQSTMRLMSGNLKSRPIGWLLQTAAQSELTGVLTVQGLAGTIVVQFGLGRPVHAVSANSVGTDAILELFAWPDGNANFVEGAQPETTSVQDNTDEILKQGSKTLESLGFLARHGMDANSVLSRPPIGLSEEQLEQRLKDGFDYGFKIQRSFYRALDGRLALREVGAQISLDSSRLFAIAVNFLKLGLILTPDGHSLREVAHSGNDAFANAQAAASQSAGLKPPPGFFGGGGGGGGFGTGEVPNPAAMNQPQKQTSEMGAPPMPPASVFGGGMADTASGAQAAPVMNWGGPAAAAAPAAPPAAESIAAPIAAPSSMPWGDPTPAAAPRPTTEVDVPPPPAMSWNTAPAANQSAPGIQSAASAQQSNGFAIGATADSYVAPAKPDAALSQEQERAFFEIGVPKDLMTLDPASVKAVSDSLCNKQTGALNSPAFQYCLEREFARAFRFSTEFSLLIFCMRLGGVAEDPNSPTAIMPMASLAIAMQTIGTIKRDVDMFGHVGDKAFGLILPGVGTNQSMALVDRIVAELPKLAPQLGGKWPILHFGIAGVPQDARDLPSLMKAAQLAMMEAADKNYTRIRSSEMGS